MLIIEAIGSEDDCFGWDRRFVGDLIVSRCDGVQVWVDGLAGVCGVFGVLVAGLEWGVREPERSYGSCCVGVLCLVSICQLLVFKLGMVRILDSVSQALFQATLN